MSNKEEYDVFVCYYELLASDHAATIYSALIERGYRVFVAHLRRPYLSGDFHQIVDSVIEKCKIFILINGIDALDRPEIIRETKIAFPNGNLKNHKLWIFRHSSQEIHRGHIKFTSETNIDLSLQMQIDFASVPELARAVTLKCKNEKSSGVLDVPDMRTPPVISHNIAIVKTNNQVNLDEYVQRLQNQIKNKEYDEALETFDTLLHLDPMNVALFNNKANFLDQLGRYEEAIENYSLALSLNKKNPFILANKALTLGKLRKHDESLKCINDALSIIPKNTELMLTKGHVLFNKKELKKSLEVYEEILLINKHHSRAIGAKAAIFAVEGKKDEALTLLETSIREDPKNDNAWYNHGAVLMEEEKYDEALDKINHSLKLNPYNFFSWTAKNSILRKTGKYEEALSVCDESIQINLNKTIPYFLKGVTLFALQRYEDALQCYDKAITRNSQFPTALINKSLCLLRLNRKEDCMNTLNEVLEFVINEPDKLNIIGEMLLELNAATKAEEIFRIARIRDSKNSQLASNLFLALYEQKKFDESILFCNQILDESPNDIQFLLNRSAAFIKLKKFEQGLADCDKVLGFDETIGVAYYNKACVSSLQNIKIDTLQLLKKAIDYDPRSKELAKSDEDFENLKNDSEFRKLVD